MTSSSADFIIELGTEELPPKSLSNLAKAFHQNLTKLLKESRLGFIDSKWLASPRRLTVIVEGLSITQDSIEEQKLGPAVSAAFDGDGNPKPAALGFARSCGVDVEQLQQLETEKGLRLGYTIKKAGAPAKDLLADLVKTALKNLPIAKQMRWGNYSEEFVRPVKWVMSLLGNEVVPMRLFGQTSQNTTRGHRFHAPKPFVINSAQSYQQQLQTEGKVMVDFEARKAFINKSAVEISQAIGNAIIDPNLLNEVTGLVEWPQAILGTFDEEFLAVPEEALISSMQEHQKYFPVRDNSGKLSNHFIAISNLESSRPQSVVSGNEKVIRPRLADAKFFFDTDRKQTLQQRCDSLKTVLFQHKLGTIWDKSQRVAKLCEKIAPFYDANIEQTVRAAQLAKCDLMTEMVGEFPSLQGIMGRYYAEHDGEDKAVSLALDEQYMPRFSGNQLPQSNQGLVLALAERMDSLVGLFGIGQPPKGAKDPFALRRAAVAVLRLLMAKPVDLSIPQLITWSMENFDKEVLSNPSTAQQLEDFLYQRYHAMYQDQGIDANIIHAVMARRPTVAIDFDRRVKAVAFFRSLEESEALAAANKRVANILAKQGSAQQLGFQIQHLQDDAEKSLFEAYEIIQKSTVTDFENGDYQAVMKKLASLREPLDNFFDKVMVMADDEVLRNNRLALLQQISALFLRVADISLLH